MEIGNIFVGAFFILGLLFCATGCTETGGFNGLPKLKSGESFHFYYDGAGIQPKRHMEEQQEYTRGS